MAHLHFLVKAKTDDFH